MSYVRLSPDVMPWSRAAHPLERKKASAERPMVLIEFAPGFADPNECMRSHIIYMVSGELVVQLGDREERLRPGEACWLDAGTGHRARNDGTQTVVAFIASDLERSAAG
jgi:quercetin dioxygenase-like cupin family protein